MPRHSSSDDLIASWDASDRRRFWRAIDAMRVQPGTAANLRRRPTAYTADQLDKRSGKLLLEWGKQRLAELHETLYADNRHSLLIVFQAMDTGGKDGAIKHIMSGLNPQGVKVTSFKHPSTEELDHDFLWRHYKVLPPGGEIGIFNRSHYENVLISRVHPELVLHENLPDVRTVDDITDDFWRKRLGLIRQFESLTVANGTVILKFFLHISKEEQRKRLLARIDDEDKNWKFSVNDLHERAYWDDYQAAYEDAITATSTSEAPWFVIPADDKWYARLSIGAVIYRHMQALDLRYPRVSAEQRKRLLEARQHLIREGRP